MKDLNQCRAELDVIDAQMVWLFEKRMQVVRDVALYKHEHNMDIFDSSRENAVLESRAAKLQEKALKKPPMWKLPVRPFWTAARNRLTPFTAAWKTARASKR